MGVRRRRLGSHAELMSPWITALLVAILLATVPLTWIFRILRNLPPPLLLSHRRWPAWVNFALIGAITGNVTVFVRGVYYGGTREPLALALQFLIAAVIYFFGFVLIVRQFAGVVSGVLRDHGTNRTRHSQSPIPQRCRYRRDERIRRRNAAAFAHANR